MKNERRAHQLGMPYGTASNRLKRMILFSFAKRLGEDICFKCGQRIETVEHLSVEHKLPWEGKGRLTELFWDLTNIAFSHLACNRPHRFSNGRPDFYKVSPTYAKRINAPVGHAWCSGHKGYRKIEEFHSNERNISGVASYCKECRKSAWVDKKLL